MVPFAVLEGTEFLRFEIVNISKSSVGLPVPTGQKGIDLITIKSGQKFDALAYKGTNLVKLFNSPDVKRLVNCNTLRVFFDFDDDEDGAFVVMPDADGDGMPEVVPVEPAPVAVAPVPAPVETVVPAEATPVVPVEATLPASVPTDPQAIVAMLSAIAAEQAKTAEPAPTEQPAPAPKKSHKKKTDKVE